MDAKTTNEKTWVQKQQKTINDSEQPWRSSSTHPWGQPWLFKFVFLFGWYIRSFLANLLVGIDLSAFFELQAFETVVEEGPNKPWEGACNAHVHCGIVLAETSRNSSSPHRQSSGEWVMSGQGAHIRDPIRGGQSPKREREEITNHLSHEVNNK